MTKDDRSAQPFDGFNEAIEAIACDENEFLVRKALRPVLERLAACDEPTAEAALKRLKNRFSWDAETLKSYRANVKRLRREHAASGDGSDGDDGISGEAHASPAEELIQLVLDHGTELLHDDVDETFARIHIDDHFEIHRLASRHFKQHLARLYWQKKETALKSEHRNTAVSVLEAKARFEGETRSLHNRVAWHENAIWIDLGDSKWRAVRITPHEWRLVDQPPILFRRFAHQQALPTPVSGGKLDIFLEFTNIRRSDHRILLLVWLVAALVPDIPHFVLLAFGGQGSAKTTLMRMLRRLIDPSATETLSFPTRREELVQQLSHHAAPMYDNLPKLPLWASDALCRAVTGEGSSKRQLYSDDDDVIYRYRRCIGLNGINVAAYQPDLLDRCLLLDLKRISSTKRRSEARLWTSFEEARPEIFGAMLDALSRAMALRPKVDLAELPRMADFTLWGCAIAEALGYEHDTFLSALDKNFRVRDQEIVSETPVAQAVMALVEQEGDWEGTPSELLAALDTQAEFLHIDRRNHQWPRAANILTRQLNRLAHTLAACGVDVDAGRTGESRRITLKKSVQKYRHNRHYRHEASNQQNNKDLSNDGISGRPDGSDGSDGNDGVSGNLFGPGGGFVDPDRPDQEPR